MMPVTRLRYRCLSFFVLVLMLIVPMVAPSAHADTASEQEIKAAIIIKLTKFIKWPATSFKSSTAPFTIEILGENYFEGLFDPFLGRQFQDRRFVVRNVRALDEIGAPQILIISPSERQRTAVILDKLAGKPILTVGDFPDFAEQGGLISLYRKPSNNIGFKINIETQRESGLTISSYLLKMGKLIHPEKRPAEP